MPPGRIACRVSSFRPFEQLALPEIARLGLRFVEFKLPDPADWPAMRAGLASHGLSASCVQIACPLDRADVCEIVAAGLDGVLAFDAPLALVCCHSHGLPGAVVAERLRGAAEEARKRGLRLALETHPDLAENAAVSRRTLAAVDHPSLGINFDPANIYFYNEGLDAVAELRGMAPRVLGVHLKDTPGRRGERNFPALGQGMVDFPAVFAALDEAGFAGPFTIEIEGIEGEARDEALVRDRVRESMDYLRRIGRLE